MKENKGGGLERRPRPVTPPATASETFSGGPRHNAETGIASRSGRARSAWLAAACLAAVLAVLTGCSFSAGTREAENVILVVGDGMGAVQRNAIQLASVGTERETVMDSLPYAGTVGTAPAGGVPVTDSAAAATAMASGVKTRIDTVGLDAEGEAVPTVLERAKEAGKATGLVTTSSVTDATPAAFAAHLQDRHLERQIARQYLQESKPNVVLGGGREYWEPTEEDPRDLTELARRDGYTYVTDQAALDSATGPKLLGLLAEGEMYEAVPEEDGGSYDPPVSLPEMTRKALGVLGEDPDGFFLLVEEEAIDSMGHAGNATQMLEAGKALDRSVKVAKDFAEQDNNTLLIVVGDHECCGTVVEGTGGDGDVDGAEDGPFPVANSDSDFIVDHAASYHTAVDVPLTAMGPGGERLTGTYENTRIHGAMMRSMGLDDASE